MGRAPQFRNIFYWSLSEQWLQYLPSNLFITGMGVSGVHQLTIWCLLDLVCFCWDHNWVPLVLLQLQGFASQGAAPVWVRARMCLLISVFLRLWWLFIWAYFLLSADMDCLHTMLPDNKIHITLCSFVWSFGNLLHWNDKLRELCGFCYMIQWCGAQI